MLVPLMRSCGESALGGPQDWQLESLLPHPQGSHSPQGVKVYLSAPVLLILTWENPSVLLECSPVRISLRLIIRFKQGIDRSQRSR